MSTDNVMDNPNAGTTVPAMDRRQGIGRTVSKLVDERQSVFVVFCELAGVSTFDADGGDRGDLRPEKLTAFLELLMDYLGAGHFELYQRIIDGHERRRLVLEAAQKYYPTIAETTDFLVEFNDKYDGYNGESDDAAALEADLSKVGKALSLRTDLEDKILSALQA
ncbi:MAG: Rsd/AlgQ family anti-sigma factor [Pseudomonadota bacterium]